MLTTIRGIYQNGIITLLEKIDIKKADVIITFLETNKENIKDKFLSAAGSWNDIDTEKLKEKVYKSRELDSREINR